MVLANSCFQAVSFIGYPEAEIILSQTTVYLASSSKSNATYSTLKKAKALVNETGDLPVPLHLRNAPTKLMKEIGYGDEYKYAHDYDQNFVGLEYFPEKLSGHRLYEPQNNPREIADRKRLKAFWKEKYGY